MAEDALFDLMSWMSPAWPIGAFSHSSGLEWAVEERLVVDRASAQDWVLGMIEHGAIRNDVVLFVHAWRAVDGDDAERLGAIAELASAAQTSAERRLESMAQGAAFRRIALSAAGMPRFEAWLAAIGDEDLAYPIAAAVLFACRGIGLRAGLTAWLHGAVSNLVSAAQRLVPLGQTDGQRVIAGLRPAVLAAVERACAPPDDGPDKGADADPFEALGGCTLLADLGCMAHETQYTRLFRT